MRLTPEEQKRLAPEEIHRLDVLYAAFELAGGRGVELAEEIDELERKARSNVLWIVESGSGEFLAEHTDATSARQDATNRRARLVRRVEVNGELVEDALIHDFGAEREVTEGDLIYRTVFQVEVFGRRPLHEHTSLSDIEYEINEGDCIGSYSRTSVEIVPTGALEDHLLRIGNDGTFFKDPSEDFL